jgi:hypothetical protein
MKILLKKIYLFAFVFFLLGCNDELSRDEAKEKIINELKLPFDEIKSFKIEDNTYFANQTAVQYELLKKLGFLDYSFEGEFPSKYHAKAKLTDKGSQFVVSEAVNQGYFSEVEVKVAKIEFGEITGIQEVKLGDLVSYYVEYTVKRTNINSFGTIIHDLDEKIIKKKVKFTKFDDGWRPSNLNDLKDRFKYEFDKSDELF